MSKKNFVLDTNVLLNDPRAPFAFEGHNVYIPMVVLEELDNIKMRKSDLARDGRAAVRTLNDILGENDAAEGVEFGEGSKMFVVSDVNLNAEHQEYGDVVGFLPQDLNDNKIINNTLKIICDEQCRENTVLVSNDINMRLKAKAAGVKHAQEYRAERVVDDVDMLPSGTIVVADDWFDNLPEDKVATKGCGKTTIHESVMPEGENFTINDWLIADDESMAAKIVGFDNETGDVHLVFENVEQLKSRRCSGIFAQDIRQSICVDALLDDGIDIVIIDGPAGSGKTLLTMAASTEIVKGKKKGYKMEEIIFTRTEDTQFKAIGFLKGGEHEKMAPWLGAVSDNMEVIARASKNKKYFPEESIEGEDAFIKLKSLVFFRGRSFSHRILVIDEAQNMTVSQMKSTLTRAGQNCKVVILGNLAQIDNEYVTARSSGLTYATHKLHGQDFAQVIRLDGVKRSRLAEFVEENFE